MLKKTKGTWRKKEISRKVYLYLKWAKFKNSHWWVWTFILLKWPNLIFWNPLSSQIGFTIVHLLECHHFTLKTCFIWTATTLSKDAIELTTTIEPTTTTTTTPTTTLPVTTEDLQVSISNYFIGDVITLKSYTVFLMKTA